MLGYFHVPLLNVALFDAALFTVELTKCCTIFNIAILTPHFINVLLFDVALPHVALFNVALNNVTLFRISLLTLS